MHKKIKVLFLFTLSCAFLFSCKDNDDDSPQNDFSGEKVPVSFVNNSSYSVNIFVNAHRKLGGETLATVRAGQTISVPMFPSSERSGYPFYFEYNIPIGSFSFPYFSLANSQVYLVEKGKSNEIRINELTSCNDESTYLIIDNKSDSSLYLLKGGDILTPENSTNYLVDNGNDGVYLIGQTSLSLRLANSSQYKLRIGATSYDLYDSEIKFEPGNIYTITVTTEKDGKPHSVLKSVAPFDVGTQKQMWKLDDSTFVVQDDSEGFVQPLLRPSTDPDFGVLVMGTPQSDEKAVGFITIKGDGTKLVNKVGAKILPTEYKTNNGSDDVKYPFTVESVSVIDFLEQSDNSYVLLADYYGTYTDDDGEEKERSLQMVSCFDLNTQVLRWSYIFNDHYNDLLFRSECKNILFRVKDNKVAVAGGTYDNDGLKRFFCVIDATSVAETKKLTVKKYVSEDCGAWNSDGKGFETETLFTSCYYDGTDYYVAGFRNCDFNYENVEHEGIICKFSEEEEDLKNPVEVYTQKNCIFFCIDGIGSDYWACGEYWLKKNGGMLRGFYISSKKISAGATDAESLTLNVPGGTSTHSWFNQLCCYDGKIVLCGKKSQSTDGSESPIPFVAAYDLNDALQWENTFPNYQNAVSLVPNKIGTYILQLSTSRPNTVHYFSADLLGREP